MKSIHTAAIIAAMLATGAPALGDVIVQDGKLSNLPYREVRFGDLNLDTRQGMDRLNMRITAAVREVCGEADIRQLREYMIIRDCRDDSLQRAFTDRDAMIAARLAARGEPDKFGGAATSIAVVARR